MIKGKVDDDMPLKSSEQLQRDRIADWHRQQDATGEQVKMFLELVSSDNPDDAYDATKLKQPSVRDMAAIGVQVGDDARRLDQERAHHERVLMEARRTEFESQLKTAKALQEGHTELSMAAIIAAGLHIVDRSKKYSKSHRDEVTRQAKHDGPTPEEQLGWCRVAKPVFDADGKFVDVGDFPRPQDEDNTDPDSLYCTLKTADNNMIGGQRKRLNDALKDICPYYGPNAANAAHWEYPDGKVTVRKVTFGSGLEVAVKIPVCNLALGTPHKSWSHEMLLQIKFVLMVVVRRFAAAAPFSSETPSIFRRLTRSICVAVAPFGVSAVPPQGQSVLPRGRAPSKE